MAKNNEHIVKYIAKYMPGVHLDPSCTELS